MQIGAVEQVANPDGRAHPVVGETLQMVDQILSRVVFLGHRAIRVVLVAEVAVKIDLGRHDGLSGEIDAGRAGRHLYFAFAADSGKLCILDNEGGVLDDATIAGDEPRAFKDGYSRLSQTGSEHEQKHEARLVHQGVLQHANSAPASLHPATAADRPVLTPAPFRPYTENRT